MICWYQTTNSMTKLNKDPTAIHRSDDWHAGVPRSGCKVGIGKSGRRNDTFGGGTAGDVIHQVGCGENTKTGNFCMQGKVLGEKGLRSSVISPLLLRWGIHRLGNVHVGTLHSGRSAISVIGKQFGNRRSTKDLRIATVTINIHIFVAIRIRWKSDKRSNARIMADHASIFNNRSNRGQRRYRGILLLFGKGRTESQYMREQRKTNDLRSRVDGNETRRDLLVCQFHDKEHPQRIKL